MNLTKVFSAAVFGIEAFQITVEVSVSPGIRYFLVGLPDTAVKESQQRIESSLQVYGYRLPGKKIIINMSPADIRKEGASFDLPIAMGILMASEQIQPHHKKCMFIGELSLDGSILPIKGALQIALEAKSQKMEYLILPKENACEAAIVEDLNVVGVSNLKEIIELTEDDFNHAICTKLDMAKFFKNLKSNYLNFSDVKGQVKIKRAMEIAAAGGHNLLMIGSPGAGKTMISKRLPGILPPLTLAEAIETTKIHSIMGQTSKYQPIITERPFRSPHHTSSDVAIIGGGSYPMPGEVSMAHNGVLYLDELPEFKRHVIEVLRQPLEEHHVKISRARWSMAYPANCMLVASMNPCPCGYLNHPIKRCLCSERSIQNYRNKISGPFLDRIDLHIEVIPVEKEALISNSHHESSSEEILARVKMAREIQTQRFINQSDVNTNSQMQTRQIKAYCELNEACKSLMNRAIDKLQLSARAFDKILKVARTIADLDREEHICKIHLAEAIQYRSLDQETVH